MWKGQSKSSINLEPKHMKKITIAFETEDEIKTLKDAVDYGSDTSYSLRLAELVINKYLEKEESE